MRFDEPNLQQSLGEHWFGKRYRLAVQNTTAGSVPETYDLVCANLVGDLLVEFFGGGTLHRVLKQDGISFLSGISDEKRPAVLAALKADGWQVVRRLHHDVWTGLQITRQK